uniref:Vanadium-binding protein 1 n=1 Tax=Ascidia sydneiensis samea TaxID=79730 RepID=Q86BW3_ASCSS|nr:vanadium-binding protein 1 [Ascidia sydneiensis samea]
MVSKFTILLGVVVLMALSVNAYESEFDDETFEKGPGCKCQSVCGEVKKCGVKCFRSCNGDRDCTKDCAKAKCGKVPNAGDCGHCMLSCEGKCRADHCASACPGKVSKAPGCLDCMKLNCV